VASAAANVVVVWAKSNRRTITRRDQPKMHRTVNGEPAICPPSGAQIGHPGFIDYLFLAFTNATTFSPTDTFPLTARAKLLMMAEAAIAFDLGYDSSCLATF
jgi:hypothetical protein